MYNPYDNQNEKDDGSRLPNYEGSYYTTNKPRCRFGHVILLVLFAFLLSCYAVGLQVFIYMDSKPIDLPLFIAGIFILIELILYVGAIFICYLRVIPCTCWACPLRWVWYITFIVARVIVILCVILHYFVFPISYSWRVSLLILIFSGCNTIILIIAIAPFLFALGFVAILFCCNLKL